MAQLAEEVERLHWPAKEIELWDLSPEVHLYGKRNWHLMPELVISLIRNNDITKCPTFDVYGSMFRLAIRCGCYDNRRLRDLSSSWNLIITDIIWCF
jgi:hypothetical protein